jgi:hypothetical protein
MHLEGSSCQVVAPDEPLRGSRIAMPPSPASREAWTPRFRKLRLPMAPLSGLFSAMVTGFGFACLFEPEGIRFGQPAI